MSKHLWPLASAALIATATPALAHHTFAMFDRDKVVTITGTLKDLQWTNPHVWLVVIVPNPDGTTKEWNIEGGSPNALIRKGWKYSAVKIGGTVTLTMHPLKSGVAGGSLLTIKLEDGRQFEDGVSDNKV